MRKTSPLRRLGLVPHKAAAWVFFSWFHREIPEWERTDILYTAKRDEKVDLVGDQLSWCEQRFFSKKLTTRLRMWHRVLCEESRRCHLVGPRSLTEHNKVQYCLLNKASQYYQQNKIWLLIPPRTSRVCFDRSLIGPDVRKGPRLSQVNTQHVQIRHM